MSSAAEVAIRIIPTDPKESSLRLKVEEAAERFPLWLKEFGIGKYPP